METKHVLNCSASDTCTTQFAPAERMAPDQLADEIDFVSTNPVMTGLLHSVNGLIAVLNGQRQVISLNDSFLKMLGVDDPARVLGMRPGEALSCVHSRETSGGCGTTKYCSSCGAAVAIVSSLEKNEPVERLCALRVNTSGDERDVALNVVAHPIQIQNRRYILLFLKDVTKEEHRAALERTFYHDINNLLSMLVGASDLLQGSSPSKLGEIIQNASVRLSNEINIQRCLSQGSSDGYRVKMEETTVGKILSEISVIYSMHPIAKDKQLDISPTFTDLEFITDTSLLSRVLCNMVTNAMEATEEGQSVKLWVETVDKALIFNVWNAQVIPKDIALRVFQRNYSTKEGRGRGVGTYSMKLFGEGILNGEITFTSSEEDGTVFRLKLPLP